MRKRLPLLMAVLMATATCGASAESLDHNELAALARTMAAIRTQLAPVEARKADIANLLTGRFGGLGEPQAEPPPTLDSMSGRGSLHTIPVDFMLAQLRLQTGNQFDMEIEKALKDRASPALFIREGALTMRQLVDEAERTHPGAIEKDGETYIAHWPIVIWSDAALVLNEGDRLRLSTSDGAFILNSGLLTLDKGRLDSTAQPNLGMPRFRPFIATVMTGAIQARGATFADLGYGGAGSTGGLSIIGAALFPSKIRSSFVDSSFQRLSTVSLQNTHKVAMRDNHFDSLSGPAITMRGVTGASVTDNVISGTKNAQGIDVQNTTTGVDIDGNIIIGNRGSGIFIANDVRDVQVTGNLLSGNGRGGVSVVRSACITVADNFVVSNSQVGIKVRASDGLTLSGNALVTNAGAGISIIEQEPTALVAITANSFTSNKSGVHGGSASEVALRGNDFSGQSPVLLDGEFAAYVPELLNASTTSPDGSAPLLNIHAHVSSSTQLDCKTGS